jgi:hypothetical protein
MNKLFLWFIIYICIIIANNSQISPYSGANVKYEWVTANNLSYLCSNKNIQVTSGGSNKNLICAQTEYP